MARTKKTIDNKISKLSERIQAVNEGLKTGQSTEKLKQELASITQALGALYKNIQSEIDVVITSLNGEVLVQEGGKVDLISYNHSLQEKDDDEEKKDKESSKLDKLTENLKQCKVLDQELTKLKRCVKSLEDNEQRSPEASEKELIIRLEKQAALQKHLKQEQQLKPESKDPNSDKIVDELNENQLKYTKEAIKASNFYKRLSMDVKSRIDEAKSTEGLYSILMARLDLRSKGLTTEELVTIGAEVDFKMQGKLSEALADLERSGKEVIMNEDGVFCLVDKKRAESVIDQLEVSSAARTTQL